MSEAKLVKDCTTSYVSSTLALLQNHVLEFGVGHGLQFQGRDIQESFIFIQQRIHDVEPRWASDSWPTVGDHHESQRPPLVEFLPKTHIEVCVVEVRLLPPQTSSSPRALQPPHLLWTRLVGKTGRLPSSPSMYVTGVPFCSHATRFVNGSLAFLQMRAITRIKKLSWTACAAACRHLPFSGTPIRTISGFLELISRFEFDFRRCENFFFE